MSPWRFPHPLNAARVNIPARHAVRPLPQAPRFNPEVVFSKTSESANQRISESKNHLRGKCNANFRLCSGRPPRNEFRVCYVKVAEANSQTTRFSVVDACQAGDEIPSRSVSRCSLRSRLTFSCLLGVHQRMASPFKSMNRDGPLDWTVMA